MSKQVELERLDREIKNGEIRLRTVKTNIELLDKEISSLSEVEAQLAENIRCLKKRMVIAMANEFKKAKEDLVKTRTRLTSLQNDRENFKKSADQVEKLMQESQERIEKLKKSDNVLQGNFGKRNG